MPTATAAQTTLPSFGPANAQDRPATDAAAARQPSILARGFNVELLQGDRPERIFAYHLQHLGIERVLDIGSNSGQFASKLRRFGYQGVIYSVEPLASAHQQLLTNARHDPRWFPLPRQGAGAKPQFLSLNVAENSHSSSLRQPHDNHLRAESSVRTVGVERVFVNAASRLLRDEAMREVEALKIDVQGYEDEVITGYLPLMDNVRLLLLEMSLVECYRGAPDLLSLHDRLIRELGFSPVSLEPSYYDDTRGVVQQYDGIYFRPERPARPSARRTGVNVGAVVTSVGGTLERRLPDGSDLGPSWLQACMQSWRHGGCRAVSVAERAPPEGIEWVQTEARPNLAQMLAAVPLDSDSHLLLTNADIVLMDALWEMLGTLDADAVYYGNRVDVERESGAGHPLAVRGLYQYGFDYFLLPGSFIRRLLEEGLMPQRLRIGEPWWDYALPLLAAALGFPLKKLSSSVPLALHYSHAARYSMDIWRSNRLVFIQLVERLLQNPDCHAAGFLDQLLSCQGAIPEIICGSLP